MAERIQAGARLELGNCSILWYNYLFNLVQLYRKFLVEKVKAFSFLRVENQIRFWKRVIKHALNLISSDHQTVYSFTLEENGMVFVFERIIDCDGNIINETLKATGGGDIGGNTERFAAFVDSL